MSKKKIARPNRRNDAQPSLQDIESFVQNGPGKDQDTRTPGAPASQMPKTTPVQVPREIAPLSSASPEIPAPTPAANQATQTSGTSAARTSKKPVRSKFTIELDRHTHRRFKIAALQLDSTVQEEGVLALERHLRELEHRVEQAGGSV